MNTGSLANNYGVNISNNPTLNILPITFFATRKDN